MDEQIWWSCENSYEKLTQRDWRWQQEQPTCLNKRKSSAWFPCCERKSVHNKGRQLDHSGENREIIRFIQILELMEHNAFLVYWCRTFIHKEEEGYFFARTNSTRKTIPFDFCENPKCCWAKLFEHMGVRESRFYENNVCISFFVFWYFPCYKGFQNYVSSQILAIQQDSGKLYILRIISPPVYRNVSRPCSIHQRTHLEWTDGTTGPLRITGIPDTSYRNNEDGFSQRGMTVIRQNHESSRQKTIVLSVSPPSSKHCDHVTVRTDCVGSVNMWNRKAIFVARTLEINGKACQAEGKAEVVQWEAPSWKCTKIA